MKAEYEIGGLSVTMTNAQADRWNSGRTTDSDLRTILVAIPQPVNDARYITLRRALNSRLERMVSSMLDGMPANRCGEWK